jgi:hypothetical protein
MPKLRHDHQYVLEWIDPAEDSVLRVAIFPTAADALAAAEADGGDPAYLDLVLVFAGYYVKRGGPILPQERKHAFFRLRGEWRVPTKYAEGGEISQAIRDEIEALRQSVLSRR